MSGEPARGPQAQDVERDPAEVEPTDNSSGAAPDLERVEEAEEAAAEVEAEGSRGGQPGR